VTDHSFVEIRIVVGNVQTDQVYEVQVLTWLSSAPKTWHTKKHMKLTYSMKQSHSETDSHSSSQEIVKNFIETEGDLARLWPLSWVIWIQFTSSQPLSLRDHFNIIILSMSAAPDWSLLFRLSDYNFVCIYNLRYACYIPRQTYFSWFGLCDDISSSYSSSSHEFRPL